MVVNLRDRPTNQPTNRPTIGNSPSLALCNQFCAGTSDHGCLSEPRLSAATLIWIICNEFYRAPLMMYAPVHSRSYPLNFIRIQQNRLLKPRSDEHRSHLLSFARIRRSGSRFYRQWLIDKNRGSSIFQNWITETWLYVPLQAT